MNTSRLRFWLPAAGLALGLSLLLSLAVGLIHARPYDDQTIRDFLLPPPGCASPCFLGVRPGFTTAPEAVRILETHSWIDQVDESSDFYDLQWSGSQPEFVDETATNYLFAPRNAFTTGWFRLDTQLRLGDVILTLGEPDGVYARQAVSGQWVVHTLVYQELGMQVSALSPCPIQRQAIWNTPVEVQLERRLVYFTDPGQSLREVLLQACV